MRAVLMAAAAALVLGGLLLFASAPEPERREVGAEGSALRQVRTLRVERVPLANRAEVSGVLEARRSIELFAETRGPVTEVGAEELDRVEAGQLLVRVDPLLATVAVERAEAALARRESELALARSNLARRRSLYEQGVSSDAELDDAVNAERVATAALREARAELLQARDDLEKKTIRAPFAGVLRSFPPEVGEYVQDGQKVAELLDLETARASIGLSDREVVEARPGQPVEVRVEAYPGEDFAGEVLRVAAASDSQTKKFPVEVEIPNPGRRLLPGMVARFVLRLGEAEPRTLIPRDAALEEFGLRFVWVVEPDEAGWVARRRRVELRPLAFRPGELEVIAGLEAGERIAVSAMGQLRDGERIAGNGVASR
jgi:membrane fusion protein (multidrug efflux system)